ncbi:plant UBX domain-containing protein 10-like [Carica papaya]|uniref:plant UBX domain-containing protein 10-like n=1 Tax=Carica papaya TaxID=3649 RepID=UPI000B8D0D77|nr:plant UBX domain-containing protein 10-like [Carica papaya]
MFKEQGKAFGKNEEKMRARAKEEGKIRAYHRESEEQDAAYLAALQIDKGKERLGNLRTESSNRTNMEKINKPNPPQRLFGKAKQLSIIKQNALQTVNPANGATTKILIRFPNGETREQSFSSSDKIQSIYRYVDSLGLPGIKNYRLISSFPRRIFGVDQMSMTFKDAGLHSRASLFLELM